MTVSVSVPKAVVAVTVNVNCPLAVGVPDRMPAGESASPAGSVPAAMVTVDAGPVTLKR